MGAIIVIISVCWWVLVLWLMLLVGSNVAVDAVVAVFYWSYYSCSFILVLRLLLSLLLLF